MTRTILQNLVQYQPLSTRAVEEAAHDIEVVDDRRAREEVARIHPVDRAFATVNLC